LTDAQHDDTVPLIALLSERPRVAPVASAGSGDGTRTHRGSPMANRVLTASVVLAIAGVAGCGRSDEAGSNSEPNGNLETTTTTAATRNSTFGDLEDVCGPAPSGDTLTASDTGVTKNEIQVSAFSDVGFSGRPGLNQELFDSSTAFTEWCNEAGGINGRKLKLELRDAALTEFQQRIIEACDEGDFMMVGGGAAFDDTGQRERLGCGLPNLAAYVVSPTAVSADLTYVPVANPGPRTLLVGDLQYLGKKYPAAKKKIALFSAGISATQILAEKLKEALTTLGWEIVYDEQYNPAGESTWRPFVEAMKARGARGVIFVGEPVGFGQVIDAAAGAGYEPDFFRSDGNTYDTSLLTQAGGSLRKTYTSTAFYPFLDPDTAAKNPATQQYRDLIEKYVGKKGKITGLGVQSISAWLLFATAARDCGADLTRDCVWENLGEETDWTGGGLHAPQDVANHQPGECVIVLEATPDGFTVVDTGANEGIYTCDAANVATLDGDYGEGARCPNPAFADDAKPSNCAE
jgi:ABC-type branched-subunit amino acid transport system substrate-binding protein